MKFGRQPCRDLIYEQRWTIPLLAAEMRGVMPSHLSNVTLGRTPPSAAVREQLPPLLGVELRLLFTPEALAATYLPSRRTYRARQLAARL